MEDNRRFLQYLMALGAERRDGEGGIVEIDLPVVASEEQIPDGPATRTARWAWQRIEQATCTS